MHLTTLICICLIFVFLHSHICTFFELLPFLSQAGGTVRFPLSLTEPEGGHNAAGLLSVRVHDLNKQKRSKRDKKCVRLHFTSQFAKNISIKRLSTTSTTRLRQRSAGYLRPLADDAILSSTCQSFTPDHDGVPFFCRCIDVRRVASRPMPWLA